MLYKLRIAQAKVLFHKSLLIFLSLIIGITFTISYYEGKELFEAYNEAIQIINMAKASHATRSQDMAESVQAGSDLDLVATNDQEINGQGGEISPEDLTAEFSAYNAEVGQTDADPFTMASGKRVYVGAIACPRHIALGTKIEVEGLGKFTCEDRMNIRYTNNFDIFMEDINDALSFGRKQLSYKIII